MNQVYDAIISISADGQCGGFDDPLLVFDWIVLLSLLPYDLVLMLCFVYIVSWWFCFVIVV
jgi:hypothetical protein